MNARSAAAPSPLLCMLRSMAFYGVFYAGTVFYVVASLIAVRVAPSQVRQLPDGWSRFHRRCCRYLLGITVRETGVRPEGTALYAFKHESFFEAIDLPCALDHPVPFGKEELYALPGWGRVAKAYGSVTVARDKGASALRAMLVEARSYTGTGRPLAIFPEGTRVAHGTRPPLQAGFAGLYKMLGLPVIPVAVDSGPLYHRWWKRPGTITLHFGEPIEPGLARDDLEKRVHAAINRLNS